MDKLSVTKVDDLIMQVCEENGGRVSMRELRDAIDAKPATLSAATKRLLKAGELERVGKRGHFASKAALALVAEVRAAGGKCSLEMDGSYRVSAETLKSLVDNTD